MGKIYSLLTRPIRNFNIENRAERVISKSKPIPAPQYSSVKKQKEIVDKLNPDFFETHYKKDPKLHDHLKTVYIQSTDPQSQSNAITSSRPLPKDRIQPLAEYDYYNTTMSVAGKCTLREAIEFISKSQENSVEYSAEKISEMYKLDKQVVENILKNFKILYSADRDQVIKEIDSK